MSKSVPNVKAHLANFQVSRSSLLSRFPFPILAGVDPAIDFDTERCRRKGGIAPPNGFMVIRTFNGGVDGSDQMQQRAESVVLDR